MNNNKSKPLSALSRNFIIVMQHWKRHDLNGILSHLMSNNLIPQLINHNLTLGQNHILSCCQGFLFQHERRNANRMRTRISDDGERVERGDDQTATQPTSEHSAQSSRSPNNIQRTWKYCPRHNDNRLKELRAIVKSTAHQNKDVMRWHLQQRESHQSCLNNISKGVLVRDKAGRQWSDSVLIKHVLLLRGI